MIAALQTKGLRRQFGALVVAADIDFCLEAGARHALIGPNGAGKTTFVNLVTGRLAPSAGQVLLAGEDVTGVAQAGRVRRGLVRTFQINTLCMGLTALENVALAVCERARLGWRIFRPLGHYHAVLDESTRLLEQLGLGFSADRVVGKLAYGEQRLVEIALALALQPKVLLLDEPAAGVPSSESGRILEILALLPIDIAILIIEHDMEIVFRFATHISVLDQGRLVASGRAQDIAANDMVQNIYFGHRRGPGHG